MLTGEGDCLKTKPNPVRRLLKGMNKMIGVYKITNVKNGKMYIGQSFNIENRIRGHMQAINRAPEDKRGQGPLYDDMKKYGVENFDVEILHLCDSRDLDEWEERFIKMYDSVTKGYNRTDKAVAATDPKVMAKIQNEEVRKRRSLEFTKMNLKKWNDPAYRKERSLASSRLQKERLKDPEYLKEKSEQLSRYWKKRRRKVSQFTLDGEHLQTFESIRAAERESGISIHNHLNHPETRKQAGGFVWKYTE